MTDDTLPDFNEAQRQKVAELGFTALETIDTLDGETIVLDAMLIVEVGEKTDEGVAYYIHRFSTADRVSIQRGIVEHVRDDLAGFATE